MLMPKLHMHSSHLRSQQNEYKVNKAAVRRTGDILCKIICDIPVKIKLLFCVRLENFVLFFTLLSLKMIRLQLFTIPA